MSNSVTDWACCKYGGKSGGNGHMVHKSLMTTLNVGNVTLNLCEECKTRKITARSYERRKKQNVD